MTVHFYWFSTMCVAVCMCGQAAKGSDSILQYKEWNGSIKWWDTDSFPLEISHTFTHTYANIRLHKSESQHWNWHKLHLHYIALHFVCVTHTEKNILPHRFGRNNSCFPFSLFAPKKIPSKFPGYLAFNKPPHALAFAIASLLVCFYAGLFRLRPKKQNENRFIG